MNTDDIQVAQKYADEWSLWEATLLSVSYNKQRLENELIGDESNLPLAKLETQYFLNNCYIPDNFIIDSIDKIKHIPCHIIQGRFDNCTPPISAYKLSKAYGPNLTLQIVNAGHVRSDPELFAALVATVNSVPRR
jgi:proline iminopeptidase